MFPGKYHQNAGFSMAICSFQYPGIPRLPGFLLPPSGVKDRGFGSRLELLFGRGIEGVR